MKIFLVTKPRPAAPAGLTEALKGVLERLHTDHVESFFCHGVSGLNELGEPISEHFNFSITKA
ncbi:MAG: hypothetical protein AB9866_16525 [Syntrophobacteraceae bacterium]